MTAFKDELINLFFIDIHEILGSAFEYIECDSLFKFAFKKLPLMEVALLASMRIEVEFHQGLSTNSINFEIIHRCCEKNLFKDPDDDDKGFVSSFCTLEDAMLSLLMAFYYYRLKSVRKWQCKEIHQE